MSPVFNKHQQPEELNSNLDCPGNSTVHCTDVKAYIPSDQTIPSNDKPLKSRFPQTTAEKRQQSTFRCVHDLKTCFPLIAENVTDSNSTCEYHFWYSNDFSSGEIPDFVSMIPAMNQHTSSATSQPRIALMIGESSLLACLPELAKHCDIVLMVDYDHLLLHSQIKRLEQIKQCKTLEDEEKFMKAVHEYIAQFDEKYTSKINKDYTKCRSQLNTYWPFSSISRLHEVQKASEQVQFVPVHINVFSEKDIHLLSKVLQDNGASIQVMNMTNVLEYYDELDDLLLNSAESIAGQPKPYRVIKKLPIDNNALIHSSQLLKKPASFLISKAEDHWSQIDRMTEAGISKSHNLHGSYEEKVSQLIDRCCSGEFAMNSGNLKKLLAVANDDQKASLVRHYDEFKKKIDESSIDRWSKSQLQSWIKN